MATLDNGNWVRSFLGTLAGNGQNQMMPVGQAWPTYLNYANPLFNSISNSMDPMLSLFQGGVTGQNDQLSQYLQNLPGMMSQMSGSTQPAQNINGAFLDSIFGQNPNVSSAFGMMNNGSGQLNDIFNAGMGQFNNPYSQAQGDIGNFLMSHQGQNPYNQGMMDISNHMLQQGGWTDQLGQGFGNTMSQLVGTGGMTPGLQASMGAGMQGMGQGFAGLNQMMGMGQGMMGQGQNFMQQGNNWSNPYLQGGSNAAMGMLGNQGMTPFLSQGMGGVNQIASQGGQMPQLSGLQNYLGGMIPQGGYGQTQSGFDFANQLMQGGGISPYTNKGADLAYQYASGGGPSLMQGLGMSMPSIGSVPMASFTPGADVSAGPVDTGYTQSLQDIEDKAKKILDSNPLMDMNTAVSMARNDAATSVQQQMEAMMSKARARGGGPGSTVANGLQNREMAEYADQGAQAESKAMRDQANQQQGLQLQKYGIGADLSKAMEQVAASRNATSSQLAGQIASANAGIHAANASGSANVASANASIQGQLAKAQMDLFGQMAGLNANRQMQGLHELGNFSGQANNQMLAGLNAIPGLQGAANQRYGQEMDSYLKATGLQSDRQMQSLGLFPSFAGAQNANMNTAFNGLQGMQGIQNQGQLGRINAGNDLTGIGASMFGQGANGLSQYGSSIVNNSNGLASNNLLGGLDLINKMQSTANNGMGVNGQNMGIGMGNSLDWSKLGMNMSQNNVGNTMDLLKTLTGTAGANNNFQTGMGGVANGLWGTANNGFNQAFGNSLGMNQFGLGQFNGLTGATQGAFGGMNSNNGLLAQFIANNQNSLGGLAGGAMNYLQGAQNGYFGQNPSSGGGLGLGGSLLSSAVQGAAGAAAAYSDIRLKKNVEDLEYGLDTVEKIRPVKWNWKADNETSMGVIAQELEKVVPEAVVGSSYLKVQYDYLIPILIKAVQELSEKVKNLEKS